MLAEGEQRPGEAQELVRVDAGEEDSTDLQHLHLALGAIPLRPLGDVEQEPLVVEVQQDRAVTVPIAPQHLGIRPHRAAVRPCLV